MGFALFCIFVRNGISVPLGVAIIIVGITSIASFLILLKPAMFSINHKFRFEYLLAMSSVSNYFPRPQDVVDMIFSHCDTTDHGISNCGRLVNVSINHHGV